MAFGGAAVFLAAGARTGQSQFNIVEASGVTLGVNVAAAPVRANADTGVFSSNTGAIDAVPANTTSLPAGYGKGPDDWTQTDVDALTVIASDNGVEAGTVSTKINVTKNLVANVNPPPAGSSIANANAEVIVHSLGLAGTGSNLVVRIISEHTGIR